MRNTTLHERSEKFPRDEERVVDIISRLNTRMKLEMKSIGMRTIYNRQEQILKELNHLYIKDFLDIPLTIDLCL